MSFNKSAVFAVFNRAEGAALSFAEELMALGVADRSTARPLALEWASKKYAVPLKDGQRGLTLDAGHAKYETAKKAADRVVAVCFPATDAPKAKAGRAQQDPVEKLLAAYAKLTAGQKRSFKAQL